ncbi:MAG: hypothetical protein IJD74_07335 [Clostridia bacterium]|nr:hypothetical protein [Clostridia bacterium]
MTDGIIYFPNIVGNDALIRRLSKDISENRLSHAYVLEGAKGSGRHTIAKEAIAAIECEARSDGKTHISVPCGRCKSCEKILSGKSPDVITLGLEGERSTIGVEAIRNLKNDIFTAPNDLSVKAYIIEDADLMTPQAQNAFLLSLEEPPSYIIFFLICENSENLLETVRSRAPTLRTQRSSSEELEEYLLKNDSRAAELKNTSPREWEEIVCASQGSIGNGLELLDAKKRARLLEYRGVAKKLVTMLGRSNKVAALESISSFGTKRSEVCRQLSFLQSALRDLLLLKKCETAPLCFFERRDDAIELSTNFTAHTLLSLYDASLVAMDDLEANANVRLTLMNMLQSAGLI